MTEYFLEDFEPGSVLETPTFRLTREQLVNFAQEYDPRPFHLDEKKARDSVFGGLVASGFQTAALAWKLGLESGYFNSCAMAGIGIDNLRWLRPVRVGDSIKCQMTTLENRPSRSKTDRGVAVVRYTMLNQNDEVVLTLDLLQMLRRKPQAGS